MNGNINWFAKLKFQRFSEEVGATMTELDTFADYHFDNGVSIRVVTGQMAHTSPYKPYEIVARRRHGNPFSLPNLDKQDVNNKMEDFNNEPKVE